MSSLKAIENPPFDSVTVGAVEKVIVGWKIRFGSSGSVEAVESGLLTVTGLKLFSSSL